jgi:hypothetical protein
VNRRALRNLEADVDGPLARRRSLVRREPTDAGIPSGDHDPVHHPAHYMWIPGHECREIARHFSYNVGQAIGYCYRHRHKGRPVQDLEKAVECLLDEIKLLKEEETET